MKLRDALGVEMPNIFPLCGTPLMQRLLTPGSAWVHLECALSAP